MKNLLVTLIFGLISISGFGQTSVIKIGEEILKQNPTLTEVVDSLEKNGFSKDYAQVSKNIACSYRAQYFMGSTDSPTLIANVEKDCPNNTVQIIFVFEAMGDIHKQLCAELSEYNYEAIDSHIYSDGNSTEEYLNANKIALHLYSFPEKNKIRVDMIRHYSVFE